MNNEMNVVVFWKIYKIIPELLTVQRLNDIQLRTPVVVHFSDQLIHEWNSNTFRERYTGKKKIELDHCSRIEEWIFILFFCSRELDEWNKMSKFK